MTPNGEGPLPQNIRALVFFLRGYAPFNQMDDQILAYLVENGALRFYPAGEVVLSPARGAADGFYVVKQGRIRGERAGGEGGEVLTVFEIGPGDCFPLSALLANRPTRTVHRAATDTFCLTLPRAHFVRVFAESLPFRNFCLRGVSSLLDEVNRHIQVQAQSGLGAQFSLDTTLETLASRAPITCSPEARLREAVQAMHGADVGSIVAVDGEGVPVGIFTLRDLRHVLAGSHGDLDTEIRQVMTPNPRCLAPQATAFEAALLMARHHFAHVPVVEDGRLVGVVSERDVFSLQRVDLVHLARTIANAPTVEVLAALQGDVARMAEAIIAHGASSEQLNHVVTLLNDYTARQAIRLCARQGCGDLDLPLAWLCFGSAGRKEQTLLTDQDNGLVFEVEDPREAEAVRQRLLPVAQAVNQALARCGFALCKGNVMAGNPQLCLSREEWGRWFLRFVDNATEQNLLYTCIFFDLRAQWGDPQVTEAMFAPVRERLASHTLFQHLLARAALLRRSPLGLFGFTRQADGHGSEGVDLKMQGLSLFVDAVRVFALAVGVTETNTVGRLRALSARGALAEPDVRAWEEAINVIQLLRMRHHLARRRDGLPLSNTVDPDHLNSLEQRILKEACRQAQRLQQALGASYHR